MGWVWFQNRLRKGESHRRSPVDHLFLPPANVVCAKVMFSQVSVILLTGGGHVWFYAGGHAWFYSGGMRGFIRGCARFYLGGMRGFIRGGMHGFMWGACVVLCRGGMHGFMQGGAWFYSGGMRGFMQGGMRGFMQGGMRGFIRGACMFFSVFLDTMRYGQLAGGTHPTGMHSCTMDELPIG